jgi:tripartite-type tricarboxylate transporter receptor subunit TctC
MITLRGLAAGCFSVLLMSLTSHHAWSQSARPIKIIVPLAAGSSIDILARAGELRPALQPLPRHPGPP